jgi:hypothetical protein
VFFSIISTLLSSLLVHAPHILQFPPSPRPPPSDCRGLHAGRHGETPLTRGGCPTADRSNTAARPLLPWLPLAPAAAVTLDNPGPGGLLVPFSKPLRKPPIPHTQRTRIYNPFFSLRPPCCGVPLVSTTTGSTTTASTSRSPPATRWGDGWLLARLGIPRAVLGGSLVTLIGCQSVGVERRLRACVQAHMRNACASGFEPGGSRTRHLRCRRRPLAVDAPA